jgi:hypothetical protein
MVGRIGNEQMTSSRGHHHHHCNNGAPNLEAHEPSAISAEHGTLHFQITIILESAAIKTDMLPPCRQRNG